MNNRLFAGVACAALSLLPVPAFAAATTPELPASVGRALASDPAVDAFYAARGGAPMWLAQGPASPAAAQLITVLNRAALDGFEAGPAFAAQAQALLQRASGGDTAAAAEADRLLSTAWVRYVEALERPASGVIYADNWVKPRPRSPRQILQRAAAAPSLAEHVSNVSQVNPFYAALRDAAWQQLQATGGAPDPRVLGSLDRARVLPAKGRYVVVDAATQKLLMVEDGRVADSMKVIVGKPGSDTPLIASVLYAATVNPYWNVPPDLVQKLIAPRVLAQGADYLKVHNYQLLDGFGANPKPLAASDVDWKAVAAGQARVRIRQLPGPGNSMGDVKYDFPNNDGIFLHDSPEKELFAKDQRYLSNGCVRLEDAQRLGRWLMMGPAPQAASDAPEQRVLLPRPVPVYVTYLTAQADNGQLAFADDVYGRDSSRSPSSQMAALH